MSLPTLTEFFETSYAPKRLKGKDPKTEKSYRETMSHWGTLTPNPPVDEITEFTIADFVEALKKVKGKRQPCVKVSTVRKHCINLETVLKALAPRSRSNKSGMTVLKVEPPWVEMPKAEQEGAKEIFTLEEMRSMYLNAGAAKHPHYDGVTPEMFFRAVFVVIYRTGMRRDSAFRFEWSMIEGEWLTLAPRICKQAKGRRLYLHQEAIDHIEAILRPDLSIVLAYPNYDKRQRVVYDQLHMIQAAAGMPESRWFGFHAIRRLTNTIMYNLRRPEREALELAQKQSGHTDSRITREHYISMDAQDLALAEAINQMPSICHRQSDPAKEPPAAKTNPDIPPPKPAASIDPANPKGEPQRYHSDRWDIALD